MTTKGREEGSGDIFRTGRGLGRVTVEETRGRTERLTVQREDDGD